MVRGYSNIGLILLVFILLVLACSDARKAKSVAELAITDFHERFNSGQLGVIYEKADANFRNITSEDDFNKLMEAVSSKLGKVKSTDNQNWDVRTFNFTTSIVLIQNTEFEKGSGTETFTFVINDGKATLFGYYISSDELIENLLH